MEQNEEGVRQGSGVIYDMGGAKDGPVANCGWRAHDHWAKKFFQQYRGCTSPKRRRMWGGGLMKLVVGCSNNACWCPQEFDQSITNNRGQAERG
jgi:hypothetical protein